MQKARPKAKSGKPTPHTSLTNTAREVVGSLRAFGLSPYPGVIDPRGGSSCRRIMITVEEKRIKITVSGEGVQDLFLYGSYDKKMVVAAVTTICDNVKMRDPFSLWSD